MKKRGKSTAFESKKDNKEADGQVQRSGRSILDLPMHIFFDILLRLSIKGIIMCKCICKTWRHIISDPQFAKLHFAQAHACPLVRPFDSARVSRTLYLIELPENDVGHRMCGDINFNHITMQLDTKLKIPIRNAEMVPNAEDDGRMRSNCNNGIKRKRCIKLKPKDHKFNIVNSCNGFLCLSDPSGNGLVVVCNPITGEYINLPMSRKIDEYTQMVVVCGFGFSPKTNQYKVIQITPVPCVMADNAIYNKRVAEIHTLGMESWRRIGCSLPFSTYLLMPPPTYLDGAIHWICFDSKTSDFIISFDIDNERFQSFPSPPLICESIDLLIGRLSMSVIRRFLCVCDFSGLTFRPSDVWVMKEYGVKSSWTKLFSIDTLPIERWSFWSYQPVIVHQKHAQLSMYQFPKGAFRYYECRRQKWKYLKIFGVKSPFEVTSHIPSFISLKDAVMGDTYVVLNIQSGFKLMGERKDLYLAEDMDM